MPNSIDDAVDAVAAATDAVTVTAGESEALLEDAAKAAQRSYVAAATAVSTTGHPRADKRRNKRPRTGVIFGFTHTHTY